VTGYTARKPIIEQITVNEIETFGLASVCLQYLAEHGISVEQTSDIERAKELARMPEKPYLTPMMDPASNSFTPHNFFWMGLHEDGRLKLVGGVRYDDLTSASVATFWRNESTRTYGKPGQGCPIGAMSPLIDQRIAGRIVYFGDLAGAESFVNRPKVMVCFLMLAHLVAHQKWHPDVICGFIREGGILDYAIDRKYGFAHAIPRAVTWNYGPNSRGSDEWLVSNTRSELPAMLNWCADQIVSSD
jgi:hypothetical protein